MKKNKENYLIESQLLDILIVDRKSEANHLQLYIKKLMHKATILDSYKEALHEIRNRDFDLIMIEMNLSKGNGIDLIKQIRKLKGILNVLAMTRDTSRELERKAREQRVIYYMIKPFEANELQSIINHILKKKRQTHSLSESIDEAGIKNLKF
ncbi:MAG: response regulator [Desulfobacterales bacterium]|nr:response regulator [Desulfobacterales bacterium]MCP4163303.1 response regulator [Deltaproteobacteria bacterium]